MSPHHKNNPPLDRLADALAEDLRLASEDDIRAEVLEDHGDADALSNRFDALTAPLIARHVSSPEIAPQPAERSGFATGDAQRRVAGMPQPGARLLRRFEDRVVAPLLEALRTLLSSSPQYSAASLAAAIFVVGGGALIWRATGMRPPDSDIHVSSSPAPRSGTAAGNAYLAVVAEGPREDAARSNYQALRSKSPGLFDRADVVIRPAQRASPDRPAGYVAGVGPFAAEADASRFCEEARATGTSCTVERENR